MSKIQPKTQPQIQKEQTRRHRIETAFQQFAKQGLMMTKTADIAKRRPIASGNRQKCLYNRGMPMMEPADFAMGDTRKNYCVHCARTDGTMQSYQQKLDSLTAVFGLISMMLTLFMARVKGRRRIMAYILSGIIVTSIFSALTPLIKYVADANDQLPTITFRSRSH